MHIEPIPRSYVWPVADRSRLALSAGLMCGALWFGAAGQVRAASVSPSAPADSAIPAGSAQSGDQAGIVKVVQGDVQIQRRGSEVTLPVKVGDRVYAGDRVLTAADAAAGITLRDDTLMSLGPRSSFVLAQYSFDANAGDGNVAVRVLKGTMRYVTGLIGKHAPDHQQVMTPTATIGIRGTDFIVEVVASE